MPEAIETAAVDFGTIDVALTVSHVVYETRIVTIKGAAGNVFISSLGTGMQLTSH